MSFWRDKIILITGANGFVGANLTKALVGKGVKVITLSLSLNTKKDSLSALNGFADRVIKQERGTVEDFDYLNKLMKRYKVDIVYHLAAQSIVEAGKKSPIKTFEVNIKGTWNILEASRRNKVKNTILVSTAHVYGSNKKLPYKEEYFPQPSRPYETSKACADILAQSYIKTYRMQVEVPRFVNLYGPGDFNFTRIIPKVIKTILSGNNPKIWDTGAVRDFLYIDDAVDALIMLGEKKFKRTKMANRVFNFGTGKPISIHNLTEKIIGLSNVKGVSIEREPVPEERGEEVLKQYVSIEKAKKFLNWTPKISLDLGLTKTLEWYKGIL